MRGLRRVPEAGLAELVIRRSTDADRGALARLAGLDGVPPPAGEHLLAIEDGELRAALSLADGTAIANPFRPTVDLVAALRLRAERLRGPRLRRRRAAGLVARLRLPRPSAARGELPAGGVDVPPAGQANRGLEPSLR